MQMMKKNIFIFIALLFSLVGQAQQENVPWFNTNGPHKCAAQGRLPRIGGFGYAVDGDDLTPLNQVQALIAAGGGGAAVPYVTITQVDAVALEGSIPDADLGKTYAIDCGSYLLLTQGFKDAAFTGLNIWKKSCEAIVYALGSGSVTQNAHCFVTVDGGLDILTLRSNNLELNSSPLSIITQMANADNGINSFLNVTVGGNCTITINSLCQGWNGVRIGGNNTIDSQANSKLVDFSTDEGLIITLPSAIGQTNNAWSGHVRKYDSDVDVIYPTLELAQQQFSIADYASFGGNIYVTPDALGNDIVNILDGQDKRNYKIINANEKALGIVLNIGFGVGNIFSNSYLILTQPFGLMNVTYNASDNVSVVFNSGDCLIKSVEIY